MLALLLRLPSWLERRPLTAVLSALCAPAGTAPRCDAELVLRLADALVRRLRRSRTSPCLYRSLLLFRFLPEAGLVPTIHFGVRRSDGDIVAHSWLTVNGNPVPDAADCPPSAYRELYCFCATRQ
jgi:hypothetical protein